MLLKLTPERLLQDLDWAVNSPPMMDFDSSDIFCFSVTEDWYQALQKQPRPLIDAMAGTNIRMLGPYFEALWRAYFNFHPGYRLLAHNQQVNDNGKTIGEFDFIIEQLSTNQIIHLEVAIKYYLGYPFYAAVNATAEETGQASASPQAAWIGPGVNDRLDKKSKSLTERQSRLSQTDAGRQKLCSLGIQPEQPVEPRIAIRGYLFYPLDANIEPPKHSANSHLQGEWMSITHPKLQSLCLAGQYRLPKPYWLSFVENPGHCLASENLQEFNQLLRAQGPLLLTDNWGIKRFVVSEDWPHN